MFIKKPLIALLTDFGTNDGYVAAMKACIYKVAPGVPIIDITHQIEPQAILSAGFILYSVFDYFPPATIFVCVVDPEVGTKRKILLIHLEKKYILVPDNGLISLLVRFKGQLKANCLALEKLKLNKISNTFQGRDIFAPAAARLALGRFKKLFGPPVSPVVLEHTFSHPIAANCRAGVVLHFDRFGNAITSLHYTDLPASAASFIIEFKGRSKMLTEDFNVKLHGLQKTYADVAPYEPLAYIGSSGFVELALRNGSARQRFMLKIGDQIKLSW